MVITWWDIAARLGLAVLLGGAVGFERESHNRPAGFRTHILVCVGAALIMMVSAYGFTGRIGTGYQVDPGRIAAQVVTGVGFLGAGTILRHRGGIQGLTTAASIWTVSAVGLAVGIGFNAGAIMGTAVILVSLLVLGRVDQMLLRQRRFKHLSVRAVDQPGLMGRVAGVLGDLQINIRKINLGPPEYEAALQAEVITMDFQLTVPARLDSYQLFRRVACLKGVLGISWEGEDIAAETLSSNIPL